MSRLPLSDVTQFIVDGTHSSPARTEGGVPVLSAQNVASNRLSYITDRFTSEEEYRAFKRRVSLDTGDMLLTIVGTIGRSALVEEVKPAVFQRSVAIMRFNQSIIDPRYALHVTATRQFQSQLTKYSNQSAQAGVYLGKLARVEIPVPPLEKQRRIATILDKADALRRKRKRALGLLGDLTQPLFLEMFGDPSNNPKNYREVVLGDVVLKVSDGPHVSPTYSDDGVPFLSTRHLQKGIINWNDLKYIDTEQANINWVKCRPERGDILYSKGGTTGIAAMVDTDKPFAIWVHLALLKPNRSIINSRWLETMLNSEFCYKQSQRLTHGIANRDLGLTRMINIKMYLPPLVAQKAFAEEFARLAKVRQTALFALHHSDGLIASLQHRAFSGQL